jgi:hypothetical protein
MVLEVDQGPVNGDLVAPFVGGGQEHAGFFEGGEEEAEDSLVGDGVIAVDGKMLRFANEGPEVLKGGVGIPVGGDAGSIGFKLFEGNVAIRPAEVSEKILDRDVGEAEVGISKEVVVAQKDGLENLSFELLDYREVVSVLIEVTFILAIGFGDLGGGGSNGMDGSHAGVDRKDKGDASASEVVGISHYDGQMTVCTTTLGGVNCASVGVKLLLEELDGWVAGIIRNGGERSRMWKGERRHRRHGREAHLGEGVLKRQKSSSRRVSSHAFVEENPLGRGGRDLVASRGC